MDNSILATIRQLVVGSDDTSFDLDLRIHINTAFSFLYQMGIGPTTPFKIVDESAVWSDFIADNDKLESVITYIYAKVKLVFDPPANATLVSALNQTISECEWRLNNVSDPAYSETKE